MAHLLEANRKRRKQPLSAPSLSRPSLKSGISITYEEIGALTYASRLIPLRTPKRWELMSTLVSDYMLDEDQNSPVVHLCKHDCALRQFNRTAEDCKQVTQILHEKYPGTLDFSEKKIEAILSTYPERNALKHIILIPPVKECCGLPIIIRSRPSFPLVYTTQGTFVAALFNGECRKGCSKKFHYSYYHQGDATYYYTPQGAKYFQSTSQTVFEVALLDNFTSNMYINFCHFI